MQIDAERQSGWGVVKQGSGDENDKALDALLADILPAGSQVGVDPLTATYVQGRQWKDALEEAGIEL